MTSECSTVAMTGLMAEGFRRPAAGQSFTCTSPTLWLDLAAFHLQVHQLRVG